MKQMFQKARAQSLRLLRSLRVVSRRDAITVTWLALAVALPFIHLRFSEKIIDPFLTASVPMRTDTFVYMLCSGLSLICYGMFSYRAAIPRLKVFAWLWLWYCIYDLLLFIWCYNDKSYYYLPYVIMLAVTWKLFKK